MRLFVALDIAPIIRERVQHFVDEVRDSAPHARWIPVESLHVTLKFIGEVAPQKSDEIRATLTATEELDAIPGAMELSLRGFGFFPNATSARVFWAGVEPADRLASLARALDERLAQIGIRSEQHPFRPHLTMARGAGDSGGSSKTRETTAHSRFGILQKKLAGMHTPEFGTITAREFFLYESQLLPGGPRYTKIGRFALK